MQRRPAGLDRLAGKVLALFLALTLIATTAGHEAAAAPQRTRVMIGFQDRGAATVDSGEIMRSAGAVQALAAVTASGGDIIHSYRIVPAVSAYLPPDAIETLRKNPNVSYVEPDQLAYASEEPVPWLSQPVPWFWGWVIAIVVIIIVIIIVDPPRPPPPPPPPPPSSQTVPWGITRIGAPTVHSDGNYGDWVKVAVLDTGVSPLHEDLTVAGGATFVSGSSTWYDDNGHGTHVAGTVAAVNNTVGVIGAAPGVALYAVKVLDSTPLGYHSDIVAGIDWCRTNGIQVINMSLHSSVSTETLQQACDNAYTAGIVIIAAAGNSGNSSGTGDNVQYPAKYDSVIAVAATDSGEVRASSSCTGPAVELAAPGVGVNSTLHTGGYGTKNGTSMAAPHVAGVAALVLRANPSFTNVDVRNAMTSTAVDLGDTGRDSWYGCGLVSATGAVRATKVTQSVTPPVTPSVTPSISDPVTVYITDTGKRYHRSGCRYLHQSSIPIGLKDAKAQGYTPCLVCKPPH